MKEIKQKTNCKKCGIEILRFPTFDYNNPRKFCGRTCFMIWLNRPSKKGKNHHLWKGENAHYITQHQWINRNYGKATICTKCNIINAKRYHWANISGKYHRNINDYIQLCVSCHKIFDLMRIKY